jgi:haloalkane dehalogenase
MIPPLAAAGLRVIAPDLVGFGRSDKPTRREDHSYARLVAANTGLPTGDHPMPAIWHQFRDAMQNAPTIDVARFVQSGCRRPLTDEIRRAYEAPFPDASLQAGPRAMPGLVPITPDDPASGANRAAWATLSTWDVPALIAFSDGDPITGAMAPILQNLLPGAQGRRHPVIADAGHFLQEDAGEELAAAIVDFVRATPLQ